MKKEVNVTILCANYNNECYLEDFFQSIINSTVSPRELIVVEDGSNDLSQKIIGDYSHLRFLRIIKHEKNQGIAISLNEGLREASGKYIMRLDTDDLIADVRIETQYEFLEKNAAIDIVGSNVLYYNSKTERTIYKSKFPMTNDYIHQEYRKGYHGLAHASIMGRRTILNQFEYDQLYVPAEEYDYFSRMVKQNVMMANIEKPLTYYRIHENNSSFEKVKLSFSKTRSLRKNIFGISTSEFTNWARICHQYFYRKALTSIKKYQQLFYIVLSILFSPIKIVKRLF